MEALSRLKATFEACIGLFPPTEHENIGSRLAKGWHADLRCRVKRTEPLPKMYALLTWVTLLDKSNIGLWKMHDWGAPHWVSVPWRMQAIRSWSGENKFFFIFLGGGGGELSDGGLERGIWTGLSAWGHSLVSPQVQNWTCWYSPSIQSRSPAWCALPLLLHSTQQLRTFPFPNGDIIMDGQTVPGAASLLCSRGRCFIWSSVTAWEIWLPESRLAGGSGENEDNLPHWAGAVKMVL